MTLWAIIENNKVVETLNEEEKPSGYPASIRVMEVPSYLVEFLNNDYLLVANTIEPPSPDYFRGQVFAALAAKRYEEQIKGVTINGVKYPTDPASMDVITKVGTLVFINRMMGKINEDSHAESIGTVNLKVNGEFIPVSELTMLNLLTIANKHLQSVFAIENWARNKVSSAVGYEQIYATYLGCKNREWSIQGNTDYKFAELPNN